jgi:hypothetical protein
LASAGALRSGGFGKMMCMGSFVPVTVALYVAVDVKLGASAGARRGSGFITTDEKSPSPASSVYESPT